MKRLFKIIAYCFCLFLLTLSTPQKLMAQISLGISIRIAPPALPVYQQPACPNDGFLWTPGYWAYGDTGYFWVPGVWVSPPQPGFLWTPGYWGYTDGFYGYNGGYWGRHIGFYGGLNYGYGYGGNGYTGGQWQGNSFRYNTAVTNVNTTIIHNTYINKTVINNNTTINNNTSFNGQGGMQAKPRENERAAMNEPHVQPTAEQVSHHEAASHDRNQLSSVNRGRPATAAMGSVGGNRYSAQGNAAPMVNNNRNQLKPNNNQSIALHNYQQNNPAQPYSHTNHPEHSSQQHNNPHQQNTNKQPINQQHRVENQQHINPSHQEGEKHEKKYK